MSAFGIIAAAVDVAQDDAGQPLDWTELAGVIEAAIRDAGYRLVPLTELPSEARARAGDPQTSHEAARSVEDLNAKQAAVLEILTKYGRATDEILCYTYQLNVDSRATHWTVPEQSDSGIRTRRAELVAAGLVRATGEMRAMVSGRKAQVWEVVSQ